MKELIEERIYSKFQKINFLFLNSNDNEIHTLYLEDNYVDSF